MNIVANWSYPTAVKLGRGRIKELAEACKTLGIKKPLLVTDRGLANMAITAHALDVLEEAGLGRAIFAEVDPNPNEINMEAGVKAYRDGGHDGVVAFGGGSGLDLGKTIAFMTLMPLYPEEMDLKLKKGAEALLDRFDAKNIQDVIEPGRSNVARKRFGLF